MQYGKHRGLEMIPASLVWGTFVVAIALSFFAPILAIEVIIVFDLYWMYRVLYFIVFVIHAWRQHRIAEATNWMERLQTEVDHWEEYWHVVFLPMVKEPVEIVDETLRTIKQSTFPNERILIVLAGEERAHEHFASVCSLMQKKYGKEFGGLFVTEHPANLPDEIPGKGSNLNWSGHQVQKELDRRGIPYERAIASSFDVDTVVHLQYFAHLTHSFATTAKPQRTSYQPVIVFNNNIWESPAPIRISAFGTTFWLFGELARPHRMWTFSSHSMPFKMLVDVGFWEKDMVSEDSRIFLQGVKRYKGDYRAEPLYLPVSMDAVAGTGYANSLRALYKQQRRWAWGVEHFPYIIRQIWEDKEIPFTIRWRLLWNHLEGMFTWATAPIVIFIMGWLPLELAKNSSDAIAHNAPFTLEWIMRVAAMGILFSGALSFSLLPRRPKQVKSWTWLILIAQWVLLPVTFILFGAIPAIDAQTRFALGKYLGFNVTKKRR
ncbi:hypothetical protein COV06_01540 [Candidatus Uhrbacteria bacterium CG10_big_fil_rev_8_21_14_0_10_50_16]|uniref:Glycosyltransferase 2-like domain-containing protein n=1 Tax=Candidatus Uhrbacteria bacterium CG10_big_fil_rev_8_21_14_0_10_50_16 TaxID=1975039 RepID=A0A2H0RND2_9BACT|nr:MAG: hypothetical protein COV06_01540 [Candidatus Uhrbacteria bacterium CG10_big_fil_rev_8_21_14_0_10_50_16]